MKDKILISLAAARTNAGLSQDKACEKLGISKSTLQNYEDGSTSPNVKLAFKMADVYGLPIENIKFF